MAAAQLEGNRRRRMRTVDDELFELLIRLMAVAEFEYKSATFALPACVVLRGRLLTGRGFGRVRLSVFCHHGCTALLDC